MMEANPVLSSLLVFVLFHSRFSCSTGPCESAPFGSAVIDICSRTSKDKPANVPLVLRVTKMEPCKCVLSVLSSYDDTTVITFSKYLSLFSSQPGYYSCGVGLKFGMEDDQNKDVFWDIQCLFDTSKEYFMMKDKIITIESYNVNGALKANTGYCIDIMSDTNKDTDKKLQLECGIGSVSSTVSSRTSQETSAIISIITSTSNMTDNRFFYNKSPQEDNKTAMHLAIGGSIGGLLLVAIGTLISIFIFRKQICRKVTIYEDQNVQTFKAEESQYDDLSQSTNNSIYEIQ